VIFDIWIGHRNKIGRTSFNYGSRVNQPGFVVFAFDSAFVSWQIAIQRGE